MGRPSKTVRKIIEIDEERCDGCGQCVIACAEGAIEVVNGKAKIVSEVYCDGLGACIGECPQGALRIIEREAEEFDAEEVEQHLKQRKQKVSHPEISTHALCPSSHIQTFIAPCEEASRPVSQLRNSSALSHWPIQIRLILPTAPFLKRAHLLVAADCTAFAYPDFHTGFLRGKVVMVGCPKFDEVQEYVDRFAEIFRIADIQHVTVLDMEVPCCSMLPNVVREGMKKAGKDVPLEEIVIGIRGEILKREKRAL